MRHYVQNRNLYKAAISAYENTPYKKQPVSAGTLFGENINKFAKIAALI